MNKFSTLLLVFALSGYSTFGQNESQSNSSNAGKASQARTDFLGVTLPVRSATVSETLGGETVETPRSQAVTIPTKPTSLGAAKQATMQTEPVATALVLPTPSSVSVPTAAPTAVTVSAPTASAPSSPALTGLTAAEVASLKATKMSDLVHTAVTNAPAATEKAGLRFYAHSDPAILGNRLAFLDIGFTDSDDINDTIVTWQGGINLPLQEHWDFNASMSYSKIDYTVLVPQVESYIDYQQRYYNGYYYRYTYSVPVLQSRVVYVEEDLQLERLAFGAGVAYGFKPGDTINPFLAGGIGVVRAELSSAFESYSDEGYSGSIATGVECIVNDNVGLIPSISYLRGEDEDDVRLNLLGTLWLTDHTGLRAGIGHSTEYKETGFSLGGMLAF